MERNPARRTTDRSCSPWRPRCGRRDGGGYARRPTSRSSSTRGPPGGARDRGARGPAWAGAMGRRFGEQVAIGLDYRRGTDGRPVPHQGWLDASALSVEAWFDALGDAPFGRWSSRPSIETARSGPDLEDSPSCSTLAVAVIASGGVGSAGISPHWRRWWARPGAGWPGHRRQALVDGRSAWKRRWPRAHCPRDPLPRRDRRRSSRASSS